MALLLTDFGYQPVTMVDGQGPEESRHDVGHPLYEPGFHALSVRHAAIFISPPLIKPTTSAYLSSYICLTIYMGWHILDFMDISPDTLFRALADPTRLRSLLLLQSGAELCVCELTYALEESQPKISRHLAQLREAGIVVDRRSGLWIHYRLHPDLPDWARQVIAATARGTSTESPYANDRERLTTMPNRPDKLCRT